MCDLLFFLFKRRLRCEMECYFYFVCLVLAYMNRQMLSFCDLLSRGQVLLSWFAGIFHLVKMLEWRIIISVSRDDKVSLSPPSGFALMNSISSIVAQCFSSARLYRYHHLCYPYPVPAFLPSLLHLPIITLSPDTPFITEFQPPTQHLQSPRDPAVQARRHDHHHDLLCRDLRVVMYLTQSKAKGCGGVLVARLDELEGCRLR